MFAQNLSTEERFQLKINFVECEANFTLVWLDFFINYIPTSNPRFKALHVDIINAITYFEDGIVGCIVYEFITGLKTDFA
jgi:hypothetical protein